MRLCSDCMSLFQRKNNSSYFIGSWNSPPELQLSRTIVWTIKTSWNQYSLFPQFSQFFKTTWVFKYRSIFKYSSIFTPKLFIIHFLENNLDFTSSTRHTCRSNVCQFSVPLVISHSSVHSSTSLFEASHIPHPFKIPPERFVSLTYTSYHGSLCCSTLHFTVTLIW